MSESIKRKIAALRAKTRASGCTEAEALAAAELAARLMAEHGLSEADLVMTEAVAPEPTTKPTWRSKLSAIIAYCTNTASIVLCSRRDGNVVMFIGREPGPQIALYLRDVTFRAVAAEVGRFKGGTFYRRRRSLATRRQAVADFVHAMVVRLSNRLCELFGPVRDPEARAAARSALQARFAGAVAHMLPKRETRYSEAADQGWAAGGKVPLNRGVTEEQVPLALAHVGGPAR